MSQTNPTVRCSYIDTFAIEKGTCVTVKIKCLRSCLVQETSIKRKQDGTVYGWFREYSGIGFDLSIDLERGIVTLLGADYSWHHDPEQLARTVVGKMAYMMTLRRIRGNYELKRSVRPVKVIRRAYL